MQKEAGTAPPPGCAPPSSPLSSPAPRPREPGAYRHPPRGQARLPSQIPLCLASRAPPSGLQGPVTGSDLQVTTKTVRQMVAECPRKGLVWSTGGWAGRGRGTSSRGCVRRGSPPGSSVPGVSQARIWSGLPVPSPGDLPNLGIEPMSPALQAGSLLLNQESPLEATETS